MVDFARRVLLGLERHAVKIHEERSLWGLIRNKYVLQILMLVPTLTVKSVWLFHNLKVIKLNRFIKMHLCGTDLGYSCNRQ